MNPFVNFLTELGFTDVRQTRSDGVELFVAETLKAAKKNLRSKSIKFQLVDKHTTANATVHDYYAIQDRRTIGRVSLTSYTTHSIINLKNLESQK
jgi:hypothetical protein